MLREQFSEALKQAMRDKDVLAVSTVRLIMARLKERDIEVRPKGNAEGIADPDIQSMLQQMIKQRRESIELYSQGKRPELAEKERGEIAIIERFLPKAMSEEEAESAVKAAIAATGAASIKDMGKVMAALRARHAATLDMAKAGPIVKAKLSA
jgi:uncharacterized protein